MKRILSLILSLVMVMSLSVTAFAAEGDNTKDVTATYTPTHTFSLKLAAVDSETSASIEATELTADLSTDPTTALNTNTATDVQLTSTDYTLTNWAGFPTGYKGIDSNVEVKLTVDAVAGTISISSTGDIASINNGVITIKLVKDTTPSITGMSIAINGTEQSGNAVTIKTSDSVTVTVSGANYANLDENIKVNVTGTEEVLNTTNGWTIDTTNNTATKTYSGADFASQPTIKYSNDAGSNWTDCFTVTYTAENISVDISWGAMSFTYSDVTNAWSCADGANKVTVSKTGNVDVSASVAYTQATGHSGIFGSFDASSAVLTDSNSKSFALTLSGKPDATLNNQKIGTITVTVEKFTGTIVTNTTTLQSAVNAGGYVVLGNDIDFGSNYLSINSGANALILDLNGKTLSSSSSSQTIQISSSSSNVTIQNGTVTNTNKNYVIKNTGTVTIKNCTLTTTNSYPLYNMGTSATVMDSTLSGKSSANFSICSEAGTVTLGGNMTMDAGLRTYNSAVYTILPGTYNVDISSYVDTDNYTVTDNGDGTWTVAVK